MNSYIGALQASFDKDLTTASLKVVIILWAIFVVFMAIIINNKWLLAGILAYEVLP